MKFTKTKIRMTWIPWEFNWTKIEVEVQKKGKINSSLYIDSVIISFFNLSHQQAQNEDHFHKKIHSIQQISASKAVFPWNFITFYSNKSKKINFHFHFFSLFRSHLFSPNTAQGVRYLFNGSFHLSQKILLTFICTFVMVKTRFYWKRILLMALESAMFRVQSWKGLILGKMSTFAFWRRTAME